MSARARFAPAILAAVVVAVVLMLVPSRARAESDVSVVASGARVDFPSGITFSLEASSVSGITDVSLLVNPSNQRYGGYSRSVRPSFSPGSSVRATWTWRRYGDMLPPGAEITYRWRVTDSSGTVTETPAAVVRVEDTRFQWQELSAPGVTVRWHKGDDAFGRELLATASDTITRLASAQGVDLQRPVTIHVYATQTELYSALPGTPAWIGGISIGEYDTVLLPLAPSGDAEGLRAFAHELTHELIYQITFNTSIGSRVPAWLNEGLAVVSEGGTSAPIRQALDRGLLSGTVPTLRTLGSGFSNLPGGQAQLAYAASESVVRYLLQNDGPDKMRALLLEFREGRTADDALRKVYGRGQDELENGWRMSLGLRPFDRGQGDGQPAPAPAPSKDGGNTTLIVIIASALALTVLLATGGGALLVLVRRRQY